MKCQDYQKWISDRLDGNLSQKKQLKLEEHLRACAFCRRYYEDLKMIEDRVRQWPGAELPDPAVFEDKLRERLSLKAPETKKEQKKSLITRLVPAGAAGLLLIAAAIYLFLQLRPVVEPESDLAMLMSYEESYLTLSQALSNDEKWHNEYSDDILNSIYEEVKEDEVFDEGSFNIFQEQNNNNNIEDI
ncbi:MAG: anti-sigma factor family protein [Candidatus Saccharicenans sp.]|uniref:anti-sigma factor family protein n=1 Tax=Candidatus Saccharicenans sp. TaxID=2819258 RepID=UPI00404B28B3